VRPQVKAERCFLIQPRLRLWVARETVQARPMELESLRASSTPAQSISQITTFTQQGVSKIFQSELEGMIPGTNIVLEATDYINTYGTFSNLVKLPMNSNLTMRTRNASTDGTVQTGINLVGSYDYANLEFKTQGTGNITLQTGTGTSPQAANIYAGKLTTGGGQVTVMAPAVFCFSQ